MSGSSLVTSSCLGVVGVVAVGMAVVGGVRGVVMVTSERRGDLILGSTPSLAGVCGIRPDSSWCVCVCVCFGV